PRSDRPRRLDRGSITRVGEAVARRARRPDRRRARRPRQASPRSAPVGTPPLPLARRPPRLLREGGGGRAEMTVYLVGAGPGDPGQITARGLELIRSCDVLVHD